MKKKATKNDSVYKVSLNVLGKKHVSEGGTLTEAFSKIVPGNCKGKGILTVEHEGIKRERIVMPRLLFQIFNGSRLMKEIGLKNVGLLFDF